MKKKFNITGTCLPDQHYMMDRSAKLAGVMAMVEAGEYFTINRPQQYGKTTTLLAIYEQLQARPDYLPVEMNLQGIDEQWHVSDSAFAQMFARLLGDALEFREPELFGLIGQAGVADMDSLAKLITRLAHRTPRKLVLLIDEVDASSNFDPFLRFLGMLRNKYLRRMSPENYTFHSVVLAGVHDIKSLKLKVRNDDTAQYNSPWNIAADFKVEMSFAPHEIAPMLVEYSQAEGVEIDVDWFADKLYYYTSGYPFLVSKLCKTIAEDLLPHKTERRWTPDDLEQAVQLLLRENNTLFDSLIKNLENNKELYDLTYQVIIEGETIPFNPDDRVISQGRLYGVFKQNGSVKVHNRIYEQRIYNYMTSNTLREHLARRQAHRGLSYEKPDGSLDIEAALLRFQLFLREQYSAKDQDFLERQWRLIFLAFFKPILNGQGHDFKEVEVSDEKRLDVVVTYFQHKYIIELKRWLGESYHQRGLDQLADYLDRQGVDEGYLVIFEGKKQKTQRQAWIEHRGKRVFAVWV
ncbi:MAG: AAA family ATPase [Bacteroidia bacterium]